MLALFVSPVFSIVPPLSSQYCLNGVINMPLETESERVDRIRNAQISDRDRVAKQPQGSSKAKPKSPANKKASVQPQKKTIKVDRANTAANAVHDVLVGTGIAAIPAVLAFIFLPGGLKLLAIVILIAGAAIGYLRGETLA
jgi:hypothetical protein